MQMHILSPPLTQMSQLMYFISYLPSIKILNFFMSLIFIFKKKVPISFNVIN
jgi:hypothetical protein